VLFQIQLQNPSKLKKSQSVLLSLSNVTVPVELVKNTEATVYNVKKTELTHQLVHVNNTTMNYQNVVLVLNVTADVMNVSITEKPTTLTQVNTV
jgi:hypothetical protein